MSAVWAAHHLANGGSPAYTRHVLEELLARYGTAGLLEVALAAAVHLADHVPAEQLLTLSVLLEELDGSGGDLDQP